MNEEIIGPLFWAGIGLLIVWVTSPPKSATVYLSARDIILADRAKALKAETAKGAK